MKNRPSGFEFKLAFNFAGSIALQLKRLSSEVQRSLMISAPPVCGSFVR